MFHWIYLIYPLIGICAGFLAGVLGLGGGIIIVPALLIVFPLESISPNIQVHLAVGTSMAVVIVNLAISLRSHFKHPEVYTLIPYVKKFAIGAVIGGLMGIGIGTQLTEKHLAGIFGIVVLLLAFRLMIIKKSAIKKETFDINQCAFPKTWISQCCFAIFGIFSVMMGMGGGIFTVPYLQHYRVPIRYASAMSVAIGLPLAIVGAVSYIVIGFHAQELPQWSSGFLYWPAFLGIAVTGIIFAPIGVRYAHRLPESIIRKLFISMLLIISFKMLVGV